MADQRVHPTTSDPPPSSSSSDTSPKQSAEHPKPPNPPPSKPVPPPPATYVFQLPREQIFRYPPPENAKKFEALTRRKSRKSCCRRCCCFTFCLLLFLVIAAAVSAGVLYLVFRFKSPKYTVTNIAIEGMNLTSPAPISPGFNVTIRAENPNGKVGIYYLEDSAVTVFFNDVKFSDGVLPVFYQPKKNTTMIHVTPTGSNVVIGGAVRTALSNEQNQGTVPFVVRLKAPVKLKVGLAKTWKFTVKVKCDIVTNTLNENAKIVSTNCDYSVRLW
ncbi:LOW QUALITY PROTEIN: NDR1/HIN1-like protein 13 [Primulina eburnea]|uniref:LOW QUALITY PROTEIN: NDR1/HIN1-like protein 13 n=1 Tax=Primulina eburnea TaxID=1245227 RepID=UPI003C6C0B53